MDHTEREHSAGLDIHARLEHNLARYDGRVSQALVQLSRDGAAVVCELDVVARWWGELSVRGSGQSDGDALDAAFSELGTLLEAFVADVPVALPRRAL